MTRRPTLAPFAAIVTLAAGLAACAGTGAAGGTASLAYGYMVPGAGVASAIPGLRANDTLPELASLTNLSAVVRESMAREVRTGNWSDRCTRRFGGPQVYAVIFHRTCDANAGADADPVVVVGFGADGKDLGRVRWMGASTVTALVPTRRF